MMTQDVVQPAAVVCSVCGGDARASVSCRHCGGAGVGVPSPDGFLVWLRPIDDFSIAFRKIKRSITVLFHLALIVGVLGSLSFFVWHVIRLEDVDQLVTYEFWLSGHVFILTFWVSILLGCFLIFRLSEYSQESKKLPVHARPPSRLSVSSQDRCLDISLYFSPSALDIVETAYRITADVRCHALYPAMLFAAALTSPSGGLFMARLDMSFDKVKGPLARHMASLAPGVPPIGLSREIKRTLALAYLEARESGRDYVGPMELFLQSYKDSSELQQLLDQLGYPVEHVIRVAEWVRLRDRLREDYHRFVAEAALKPATSMNRAMTARQTPFLDRFAEDLTLAARYGHLAPLIGRGSVMDLVLQAIESGRRSVILVGEPGVGKIAFVEELARRMVEERVPPELFDRRLVALDLSQLVASGDPGLATERFLAVMHEVGLAGNVILVLQHLDALFASRNTASLEVAQVLASELDKGYFIVVATATPEGWTENLERHPLGTKLIKVAIPATSADETLSVLMAKSGLIEYQQKVFFSYAALEKATTLALRYMYDVGAPENALNVLREAAVLARKSGGEHVIVRGEDVAKVVHEKTQIPVESVSESETQKLLELEDRLHARVIGQEEAVQTVSQAMRRARAELREGKRPIVNLLFLGPTGVGKTELAKALAAEYFGNEISMIRLDMSEYQDPSSIVRMIGAAGDQRGGLLTEAVRHKPFSIVLLDEIEKAHPDILNLFLQVMDDGRLTDGVGRTIDFTNTVVIMTSNAGTAFIQAEVAKNTPLATIRTALLERELKGIYRPEFLNRFDGVIVFKPLTLDEVTQIAWLMVGGIAKRLEQKGMGFTADDEAVEALARAGYDPLFGARPLRRVIQERVENALADVILRKQVGRKDNVILQADGTLRVEKAPSV